MADPQKTAAVSQSLDTPAAKDQIKTVPGPQDDEASGKPDSEPEPGSQYGTVQWLLIVLAVYSSALFYGLDTTIVAVVQGPVVERFGDVEKLGWLGIGFPLGSIATIAAW